MSEYITPSVDIPQRNLSQELDLIEAANNKYAGPDYARTAQYSPLYAQLNLKNLGQQTMGFVDANGNYVPGTFQLGQQTAEAQRQQDVSDVEQLGQRATGANLAANPFLARSLALLGGAETPDALLTTLNSQAQGALNAGGSLSPEDERDLRESSRSAFADKGLQNTDQSAIAELFNRDAARRSRAVAGQQFATSVEGLNSTMRDFLGRATQIDATALNDPWMSIIGRSGGGAAAGGVSTTPIGSGTQVFNPYQAYAQDVFSSNQNAAATEVIGNAQNQAATRAAIASIAGGSIGGLGSGSSGGSVSLGAGGRSDIRAKENIKEVAKLRFSNGTIPLVMFTWRRGCAPEGLHACRRYIGVIAQDVEKVRPQAVSEEPHTGFKRVDYQQLGIEMIEIRG